MSVFDFFRRKKRPSPPVGGVPISQIIGRAGNYYPYTTDVWSSTFALTVPTFDDTRPDYEWWDKFRNGLQKDFELVGAQMASLVETIASYVLGRGLTIQLERVDDARMQRKVRYTNDLLRRMSVANQRFFYELFVDLVCLGDAFVFVGTDGSFTSVPPNVVFPEYDPLNPRKVVSYTIVTSYGGLTIKETFTETERRVEMKGVLPSDGRTVDRTVVYSNPLGRIPIVHFAFNRGVNERFGKPIFSSLLAPLSAWNALLLKASQGAMVAGNPIPVFENLDNPQETIDLNASDEIEYQDESGDVKTQPRINWDRTAAFFLGKGGRFRFASPPVGFSADLDRVSTEMFQLVLRRMHIPSHIVGGDTQVSGQTAKEQMPSWVRFIEGLRDRFAGNVMDDIGGDTQGGGLYELIDLWLRVRRLSDSDVFVAPVIIVWSDVTEGDERIKFEKIKWAHSRKAITTKTALELLNLVEDAASEVEEAESEDRPFVEGPFDDFEGGKLSADGTPDERTDGGSAPRMPRPVGSSTPRMPAFGGGGRTG